MFFVSSLQITFNLKSILKMIIIPALFYKMRINTRLWNPKFIFIPDILCIGFVIRLCNCVKCKKLRCCISKILFIYLTVWSLLFKLIHDMILPSLVTGLSVVKALPPWPCITIAVLRSNDMGDEEIFSSSNSKGSLELSL